MGKFIMKLYVHEIFICLFILTILLIMPVHAYEYSLPSALCDDCAGMLDNQNLNEACNYWAAYGTCPMGYSKKTGTLSKNECPCEKSDLNSWLGSNGVGILPSPTPAYYAAQMKPTTTALKIQPVGITIQALDSGVTNWVKDATNEVPS